MFVTCNMTFLLSSANWWFFTLFFYSITLTEYVPFELYYFLLFFFYNFLTILQNKFFSWFVIIRVHKYHAHLTLSAFKFFNYLRILHFSFKAALSKHLLYCLDFFFICNDCINCMKCNQKKYFQINFNIFINK